MELEQLCIKVMDLARETGEFILNERKKISSFDFEVKGKQNFVTHVDTGSEKMLVKGLKSLLPEAGFIAEEGTAGNSGEDWQWIIDPIDGTTNFIHGLPPFAISIALAHEENVVLGVVYELGFKEFFYAWKGSNAFMDGREIRVSNTASVASSLIATGFPYTYFERLDPFMHSVRYFMENSHGLRRLGSAATDLVYVACGRFEAFYEYGLSPWDVAAGAFIIQQAGGKVCDFDGKDDWLFGGTIIAANAEMFG
ncbi:MAG: inositol monophosphatase, partial [Bacteroidales bacterium]|nr:inositol monophosphatase [Bacteroidales bacterium]